MSNVKSVNDNNFLELIDIIMEQKILENKMNELIDKYTINLEQENKDKILEMIKNIKDKYMENNLSNSKEIEDSEYTLRSNFEKIFGILQKLLEKNSLKNSLKNIEKDKYGIITEAKLTKENGTDINLKIGECYEITIRGNKYIIKIIKIDIVNTKKNKITYIIFENNMWIYSSDNYIDIDNVKNNKSTMDIINSIQQIENCPKQASIGYYNDVLFIPKINKIDININIGKRFVGKAKNIFKPNEISDNEVLIIKENGEPLIIDKDKLYKMKYNNIDIIIRFFLRDSLNKTIFFEYMEENKYNSNGTFVPHKNKLTLSIPFMNNNTSIKKLNDRINSIELFINY